MKVTSPTTSTHYNSTASDVNVATGPWKIDGPAIAAIAIGSLIIALIGVFIGIVIGRRSSFRAIATQSSAWQQQQQQKYRVDAPGGWQGEQRYYDSADLPGKV